MMSTRCFLACFILMLGQPVMALTHYANDVTGTKWQSSGSRTACELSQQIHDYGKVTFIREAGRETVLVLDSWQAPPHSTPLNVNAVPPPWRHDARARLLGETTIKQAKPALTLQPALTRQVIHVLEKGDVIRLSYADTASAQDRVWVDVSAVNMRSKYSEFRACVGQLLPYHFDDIGMTTVFFASDSDELTDEAKQKLDKVLAYVRAGAKISRVIVKGYTDNRGRQSYNRRLGKNRARAVSQYLEDNGLKIEVLNAGAQMSNISGEMGRKVTIRLIQ